MFESDTFTVVTGVHADVVVQTLFSKITPETGNEPRLKSPLASDSNADPHAVISSKFWLTTLFRAYTTGGFFTYALLSAFQISIVCVPRVWALKSVLS